MEFKPRNLFFGHASYHHPFGIGQIETVVVEFGRGEYGCGYQPVNIVEGYLLYPASVNEPVDVGKGSHQVLSRAVREG